MKILSLSNCPLDPLTGSGKAALKYAEGLRNLGHSVELLEPKDFELRLPLNKARQHRMAIGAWRVIRQKLQKDNYEILEFYGAEFWLAAWKLSTLPRRPLLVAHTHGIELLNMEKQAIYDPPNSFISYVSRKIYSRLFYIYFKRTDALVCLSKPDHDYALRRRFYPQERIAIVPHGIDEEYRSMPFIAEKEERVAYVGTWTKRKGIKYLCRVMTRILNKMPNLFLYLYGTATDEQNTLADFPSHLRKRIIVYPRLSTQEIARGLARAKVFFFPSQYESFGFALVEAMASSCAAVTTPTGLGAELRDREEAFLCDFQDTRTMEESILCLLRDEDTRLKIARCAWQRARLFAWEESVRKLADVYARWLLARREQ